MWILNSIGKYNIKNFISTDHSFINSLAVTVYVNSDITILGLFTSDHNVGIYSFSTKVYNILKHLINAAIVVTIPRLTAIYGRNKEDYKNQLSEIFNILIIF